MPRVSPGLHKFKVQPSLPKTVPSSDAGPKGGLDGINSSDSLQIWGPTSLFIQEFVKISHMIQTIYTVAWNIYTECLQSELLIEVVLHRQNKKLKTNVLRMDLSLSSDTVKDLHGDHSPI